MSNLLRCLEYRYSYAKHTLFETVKETTDCVGRRLMATVSVDDLDSQHLIEHYPAQTTEIPQTSTIALAWVAAALAQPSHAMPAGRSRILRDITACGRTNLLFTDDQKAVAECSNRIRRFQKSKWAVPFHGQATQLSGLCTTIRSLHSNFYHTLIDNLPRLYLMHHPQYADTEIQLLLPGGPTSVESYFLNKLCPSNVSVLAPEQNTRYHCEQFLFIDFLCQRHSGFLPPEYLEFFHQRVLPRRARKKRNRILISRRKAYARAVTNETELEHALGPLGFVSAVLEDLSIEAQIELFFDAEAVVSPHGAGLTNLLYAHGAVVVELHPGRQVFPHYYFMSHALHHDYQYWCANGDTRDSSFSVDVAAVARLLDNAGIGPRPD